MNSNCRSSRLIRIQKPLANATASDLFSVMYIAVESDVKEPDDELRNT